MKTETLASNVF